MDTEERMDALMMSEPRDPLPPRPTVPPPSPPPASGQRPGRYMLFAGGPRHGTEIFVDNPATAGPFTDLASSTTYYREPCDFTTAHPETGAPEWTYRMYVYAHETIRADWISCITCNAEVGPDHHRQPLNGQHQVAVTPHAALLQAALSDALMRRWFLTGERTAAKARPPVNGNRPSGLIVPDGA